MNLSLIAAIGKNNELGKGNQLLWKLPADLKYFSEITSGHPVIMGRKTFESIGKPLPNRRNIIVTRDISYHADEVEIAHSLGGALKLFENTNDEIFIIGGAEIYKQSIEFANKLYITQINAEDKDADAFFPIIGSEWQTVSKEEHPADEKNPISFVFLVLDRR